MKNKAVVGEGTKRQCLSRRTPLGKGDYKPAKWSGLLSRRSQISHWPNPQGVSGISRMRLAAAFNFVGGDLCT
jgi:hypothetical protein